MTEAFCCARVCVAFIFVRRARRSLHVLSATKVRAMSDVNVNDHSRPRRANVFYGLLILHRNPFPAYASEHKRCLSNMAICMSLFVHMQWRRGRRRGIGEIGRSLPRRPRCGSVCWQATRASLSQRMASTSLSRSNCAWRGQGGRRRDSEPRGWREQGR